MQIFSVIYSSHRPQSPFYEGHAVLKRNELLIAQMGPSLLRERSHTWKTAHGPTYVEIRQKWEGLTRDLNGNSGASATRRHRARICIGHKWISLSYPSTAFYQCRVEMGKMVWVWGLCKICSSSKPPIWFPGDGCCRSQALATPPPFGSWLLGHIMKEVLVSTGVKAASGCHPAPPLVRRGPSWAC